MLQRKPADLSTSQERWLISYADFITLLFAFFVVMYSVSQVNETKYRELSSTLERIFTNNKTITEVDLQTENTMINAEGIADIAALSETFRHQFADQLQEQSIQIRSNEAWLRLELPDDVVFSEGSITPSEKANSIIREVAKTLQNTKNFIQVEGFTDTVPINTAQFPSNWELSAARAAVIVKLLASNGVPPQHLAAVGYGEFQPVASNSTSLGRAQNRRVVLMIGNQQRLHLSNKTDITDSELPPEDIPLFNRNDKPDINRVTSDSAGSTPENKEEILQPITLKNGEHLFSSDPDLPRNNR